jgi:sugar lactone lactonase YvrE
MGRSSRVRVEVFADLHADVGEAPHWDERTRTLLFVDLTAGTVFRYDRSGAKLGSFPVGHEVGAVVPRRGGGLCLRYATASPRFQIPGRVSS